MNNLITSSRMKVDNLATLLAVKSRVSENMIYPFRDADHILTELLKMHETDGCRLIGAGHVTPEIAMAADRADIEFEEISYRSPFVTDLDLILRAVRSVSDIIYLANPNRVTGANFSVEYLKKIRSAVPEGLLIVDEYYHDYFGISAMPLTEQHTNLVIIRSFTAGFGISSSDAGYLLANSKTIRRLREYATAEYLSTTVIKTITTSMQNSDAMSRRLNEVHHEVLRISTELTQLGVQCRITIGDFLLLRVADPTAVGNYLARYKLSVVNLDGYPGLKNYLRCQIQSPLSNDRLIEAFRKMPTEFYRMVNRDSRKVTLRRPMETTADDSMNARSESAERTDRTVARSRSKGPAILAASELKEQA